MICHSVCVAWTGYGAPLTPLFIESAPSHEAVYVSIHSACPGCQYVSLPWPRSTTPHNTQLQSGSSEDTVLVTSVDTTTTIHPKRRLICGATKECAPDWGGQAVLQLHWRISLSPVVARWYRCDKVYLVAHTLPRDKVQPMSRNLCHTASHACSRTGSCSFSLVPIYRPSF